MATNKNQHFVPRCYLRQFTDGAANRSINLYNIDRDRFIALAPVKNQCSGDYFYGVDQHLEDAIQRVERTYANAIREILQPKYVLRDEHRDALMLFWLLQHLRTDAAARRSIEMTNAMASVVAPHNDDFRLQIKDAVQIAMRAFADSLHVVSDLKVCLVRNRSQMPFVTSDDPAVLTNRWQLHNRRRIPLSFGLNSAGNLLLLPLTPTVMCVGYDGDVHSFAHNQGWVDLREESDADAFNQHQYLNCRANIFVRDSAHFSPIQKSFRRVSAHRQPERYRMQYAVLDWTDGKQSRYVVVDRDRAGPHERAFIHSQVLHPTPTAWPRQIGWRAGGFVYSNGTGVGYVRKAFTRDHRGPPFKKLAALRA